MVAAGLEVLIDEAVDGLVVEADEAIDLSVAEGEGSDVVTLGLLLLFLLLHSFGGGVGLGAVAPTFTGSNAVDVGCFVKVALAFV